MSQYTYEQITANMGSYEREIAASVAEFRDPEGRATPVEVTVFVSEDGATVVQIDTHGDDRLRINVNDNTPFDRGVESGTRYEEDPDA